MLTGIHGFQKVTKNFFCLLAVLFLFYLASHFKEKGGIKNFFFLSLPFSFLDSTRILPPPIFIGNLEKKGNKPWDLNQKQEYNHTRGLYNVKDTACHLLVLRHLFILLTIDRPLPIGLDWNNAMELCVNVLDPMQVIQQFTRLQVDNYAMGPHLGEFSGSGNQNDSLIYKQAKGKPLGGTSRGLHQQSI